MEYFDIEPLMNNSSRACPKWMTLYSTCCRRRSCTLSRGVRLLEGDVGCNILCRKIHLIVIFGIVRRGESEPRCVWTVQACIFLLIQWSKTGPQRDSHWDEKYVECRGGWRGLMIGMRALGLHVQLSCRQGARVAGQLEGERKDFCHRPSIYYHRHTDSQIDGQETRQKHGS